MRRMPYRLSIVSLLLACAVSASAQQAASATNASVPPLINFSGTLTDANGKPLTGVVGVTFSLYNEQQALSPVWMETQNVTSDKYGHYSVQLGATSSSGLPSDIFVSGEARWLGVQAQGQAEYPRILLLSVPYALKAGDAQTLAGLPASAFLQAAPGSATPSGETTSAPPPNGAITGSGSPGFLPLWDGTTDIIASALYQSGSSPTAMIGINTATPTATLDLATGDILLEAGNLDLPQTTSATTGVITMGGAPFISACCAANTFNTFVGNGAGSLATPGIVNTGIGYQALNSLNSVGVTSNTAVGAAALKADTGGSDNTAVGTSALQVNTFGTGNTAVGAGALSQSGGGPSGNGGLWNTAVGSGAGNSNTSGNNNTFIGQGADAATQTLTYATAIGSGAVVAESNAMVLGGTIANGNAVKVGIGTPTPAYTLDVQGTANFTGPITFATGQTFPGTGNGTITGVTAGGGLTGGGTSGNVTLNVDPTQVPFLNIANTFTQSQSVSGNLTATGIVTGSSYQIGSNLFAYGSYTNEDAFLGFAGNGTTATYRSTAAGFQSLLNITSGIANTAFGFGTLVANTDGSENTAIGVYALTNNNGANNTATGVDAMHINTSGSFNSADGWYALSSNTTGSGNTGQGVLAISSNETGSWNTGDGYYALAYALGNNNTGLGSYAGASLNGLAPLWSNNTYVGYFSNSLSQTSVSNATAIGAFADVEQSNSLVLGSITGVNNCTATNNCASTNVGIGTTTPQYTLDVNGTANFTGLVKFAPNQTFPGSGGTVTSVASGTGLIGGPITTSGTLSIAPSGVTNAMLANASLTVAAGPGLTGGGQVALGASTTLNLDPTQVPLLASANIFTGNQTVNGNLSSTGIVTGSAFNIGSNLFAFGSTTAGNAFLGFAGNATTTGTSNTASGYLASSSNTTGVGNVSLGFKAMTANQTGDYNTAAGYEALNANTIAFDNVAVGAYALGSNTSGNANSATGNNALGSNTTGSFNTAVGIDSGLAMDSSSITGTANTLLGADSVLSTGTLNNATAVGALAEVGASNSLVLGSTFGVGPCTTSNNCSSTNVGIGTSTPAYTFDIEAPSGSTPTVNFGSASNPAAFTVHGTGNFTGLVSFAPNQTFPGTGNGTITGITTSAGGGLMGGGTSGSVSLGLTNSCGAGQVLQWTGSVWACSTISGGGTISGVSPGTDLVGGGSSGVVSLSLDTTKVPQLATPNRFTGTQTINGNLALTGSGNGVQFADGSVQTTAATGGGSGIPSGFMILGSTSTAPTGYTLSGMMTSGNVATSLAPMITPRYGMGVAVENGGVIYTFGGAGTGLGAKNQNEAYNVSSNTWTSFAPLPMPLVFAGAVMEPNGVSAIFGGISNLASDTPQSASWTYDILTNSWLATGFNNPSPTWAMGTALDPVLFHPLSIGGFGSGGAAVQTVSGLTSSGWTQYPQMPTARGYLATVVDTSAKKLYAIGGSTKTSGAGPLSTVEVFDFSTQTWSTAAQLPTPLSFPNATIINGQIFVFGSMTTKSAIVEIYNLATNTWTNVTTPLPALVDFGAVTVNNLGYIVGGKQGSSVVGTTELYSPPVTLYTFTKN